MSAAGQRQREALAKHVPPRLSQARLARQWEAIEARLGGEGTGAWRRGRVALALGLALAAAALVLFVRRGPTGTTAATLVDGTWLESPASGPAPAVVLADGSRVALGAKSRLRVTSTRPEAVRLDLARGRVDVRATHVEGRSFVVAAGDVEVHVVGTRFTVEDDGPVRVHVEEGRVRVHDPRGERFVSGGEEWAEESAAPTASLPMPEAIPPSPDDLDDLADAGVSVRPTRRGPAAPDAKSLLDDAQRAIAQGRQGDAARLFDAIRRDHRRDPRAGLAAFELGRLRLDSLGDPSGAEEAFRDAMRLGREAGLRDDAEARRVEALEKMGAKPACARARAAYLAIHPGGVHRSEVAARCDGS
jgi:transmembrane sensor